MFLILVILALADLIVHVPFMWYAFFSYHVQRTYENYISVTI